MPKQRATYKITNWQTYNKSLLKRGDINLWLSPDVLKDWQSKEVPRQRGRPKYYSDGLIESCLMVKHMYKLPYRATEGFIKSLFKQLKLNIAIPSYSQLSRRAEKLLCKLQRVFNCKGPIDIAVDSTGLKVYGEGEWKIRQHGIGKRRTWRKLHLAVDPLDHEIVACKLTDNSRTDEEIFPGLLNQIEDKIEHCFGDGAYDKKRCYQSSYTKQAKLIVPPNIRAKEQKEKLPELDIRDTAIRRIKTLHEQDGDKELARKQWKYEQDYHCRSIAETAMFRFKTLFSDRLSCRKMRTQITETMIKLNLMNQMTALGMPIPSVTYS